MQPITIGGAIVCLGALFLKFRTQQAARRGPRRQVWKTAKLLISALLVLMAVGFALRRLNANLDGTAPEPSLMEHLVDYFAK